MTFFVPTKSTGSEDPDNLIDLEKAQRIWVSTTSKLREEHQQKGSHCLTIEVPHLENNMYIYRYGSKQECEMEMKKLKKKLKWHERRQHIIAPGVFIFLGLILGVLISKI